MLDALTAVSLPTLALGWEGVALGDLSVLAVSDDFVPPDDWRAQAALPLGIFFLMGSVFMLLRSNLGTRRAYLLQASCFFGFLFFISTFWAFGAPGTPQYTGPTMLPGQPPDFYEPGWVPFAEDSLVAEMDDYDVVQNYPDGFSPASPAEEGDVEEATDDIVDFFSSEEAGEVIGDDWELDPEFTPAVATADNERMIVAVQVRELDEETAEADPEGEAFFAFAFFDEGAPGLPSYMFLAIAFLGFVLHVLLLGWDEREERRQREQDLAAEPPEAVDEREPTPV